MAIIDDIRLVIEVSKDTRREMGRLAAAVTALQKRRGHEYNEAVTRLEVELNRLERGTKAP